MVMSDKTSDISQFCKLKWFKWVMFCDKTVPLPDDMLKLGHLFGSSIVISPAMTTKIFMENVQVLLRSTYRPLTTDVLLDKLGQMPKISLWLEFMKDRGPGLYQESFQT